MRVFYGAALACFTTLLSCCGCGSLWISEDEAVHVAGRRVDPELRFLLDRLAADFRLIEGAVEAYRREKGCYPLGLVELWVENGRYLAKEILDPWGRSYFYRRCGTGPRPYVIWTLGADGVRGGVGENADYDSHQLLHGGR